MHVWSEGETHRVFLHNGLLVCRLWKRTETALRVVDGASALSAAARRVLASGIRPLGLVLDLAPGTLLAVGVPVEELLRATEKLRLPVAVLSARRPDLDETLAGMCRRCAPSVARMVPTYQHAELLLRGGRPLPTPAAVGGGGVA